MAEADVEKGFVKKQAKFPLKRIVKNIKKTEKNGQKYRIFAKKRQFLVKNCLHPLRKPNTVRLVI